MKLPPLLEKKFEKEVIQTKIKNNSDMIQVSQSTKNLVNAYEREVYGETMEETKAKIKAAEVEIKAAEVEIKQMDKQRIKSIILLYTRVDMPIEEIAEHLEISEEVIRQILIKNQAIKA